MQGLLRSPAGAGAGAGGCSSCAQPHSAAEFSTQNAEALQALRKQRRVGVLNTPLRKKGERKRGTAEAGRFSAHWHHHHTGVCLCVRESSAKPPRRLDRRTLVLTKPRSRHLGRTCTLRGLAHTRARLQEAQRLVCAPPSPAGRPDCGAARALLRRHGLGWPHLHAVRDA